MKKTRLRDVPKGKRWSHFWQYYGLHVFLGILLGSFALYTFYIIVLKPKTDISVLMLSDRFELSCETAMRQELNGQLVLDVNGDGVVQAMLSYVQFGGEADLPLNTRMELLTLLSAGDIYIFLANFEASQWLIEQNLLGTWGDLLGSTDERILSIPVSELSFFQGGEFEMIHHLTMHVACPPVDRELYDAQMTALYQLLGG